MIKNLPAVSRESVFVSSFRKFKTLVTYYKTADLLGIILPDKNEGSYVADAKMKKQMNLFEIVEQVQQMERNRIGRELHDNVNQVLTCAKLFADAVEPGNEKNQLAKDKSIEYILLAIQEIRKLSSGLVAIDVSEKELEKKIQSLIEDINATTSLHFEFKHDQNLQDLLPDKRTILFRIVQEQVKNIINHSKAKHAGILLSRKDENIVLEMWDDGKGFNKRRAHKGVGLSNIKTRVSIYNGTLNIYTAPAKGCRLLVTLPAA